MENLLRKIDDGSAVVGILGLGYVGLPLAMAFSERFKVVGFDVSNRVMDCLLKGVSHVQDVSSAKIKDRLGKSFFPSADPSALRDCDFLIICVPTPLTESGIPDLSLVESACRIVAGALRKGQFVILESTTYPGTTDEIVIPILEDSGLKVGKDVGVAYSPERIDPGNKRFTVEKVPKVVGGIDDVCTEVAAALYGSVIVQVVKVSNARTAESVKMVENIFRNVNIALVNELALVMERMDIDAWEVIDAAATKPYGFMPFYPGPGVGGHCIPLDPYYMSYKAKKYGFIPRFIETSGEINEFMKVHAVNLAERGLKSVGSKLMRSTVAVMGLAYKKNIDDYRESPSIDIIDELRRVGANVRVYDPGVRSIPTKSGTWRSEASAADALRGADCAIFVVDHDEFKDMSPENLVKEMKTPVVVDCKNVLTDHENLVYLGIGKVNRV